MITPRAFSLISLKGAVKLESLGMRRSRSPSAKTIACQTLGVSKRTPHAEVITLLEKAINAIKEQAQIEFLLNLCERCESRTATREMGNENVCDTCFELEADRTFEWMKENAR